MQKTKKNKVPVRIGYRYVGVKSSSHTAIMLWVRFKDKKKVKDRTTRAEKVRFGYDTEVSADTADNLLHST